MTRYIVERPWLFIVAAFTLLVCVWSGFIYVAVTRGPATSLLDATTDSIHAGH